MAGVPVADELPAQWTDRARREAGGNAPGRLSEPPLAPTGGDADAVHQAIADVRRLVFPAHGLG